LILEFSCTFVVLFVGVTVAFDKKRCKELGLAVVCVVVAGSMALAVYGKCLCISYAGRIFDMMGVKNEVCWSAMIGAYDVCHYMMRWCSKL
jgi:hypothetical protein